MKEEDLFVGTLYRVNGRNYKLAIYIGEGKFLGPAYSCGFHYLEVEKLGQTIDPESITLAEREDGDLLVLMMEALEER